MHQRGILRWRVRLRPRTQTRMGMRSELPHMQNCDIRKWLEQRWPNKSFHIVVACWGIALDHRQHMHSGEHTEAIRACIAGLDFPCLMKQCRKAQFQLWACGQATVRVMCICEGGMLKSMAIAALLHAVYQQEGVNSSGPHHLPNSSVCDCRDCQPNWQKQALTSVVRADIIKQNWQLLLRSQPKHTSRRGNLTRSISV